MKPRATTANRGPKRNGKFSRPPHRGQGTRGSNLSAQFGYTRNIQIVDCQFSGSLGTGRLVIISYVNENNVLFFVEAESFENSFDAVPLSLGEK